MPPQGTRVHIVTAVWGAWHVNAFLTLGLPSLLAPRNLPEFFRRIDATYVIYTSAADARGISASRVLGELRKLGEVRLMTPSEKMFHGTTLDDHVANHHRIWKMAIAAAAKDFALVLLVPPDLCWADGSLASIAALLAQGERTVYAKALRVTDETFTPALIEGYRDSATGVICIEPRQLVALSIDHSHPLWAMNVVGTRHAPVHSELLIWPMQRHGYVMSVLATDGLVVDTSRGLSCKANDDGTNIKEPVVCRDSDQISAVSLTPLTKDLDWWYEPRPITSRGVSTWWAAFDIPHTKLFYSKPFRYRTAETESRLWSDVEHKAARFMMTTRRQFQVWTIARDIHERMGCHRSSVVARLMVRASWLRNIALDEELTILVPTDSAYTDLASWFWDQIFAEGRKGTFLERVVADYVIIGPVAFGQEDKRPARNAGKPIKTVEAKAASGRSRRFYQCGAELNVDGIRITNSWTSPSGHVFHVIDRLLQVDET